MTIPEFIQTAIEGGWEDTRPKIKLDGDESGVEPFMQAVADRIYLPRIVLDPRAWEAVVKSKNITLSSELGMVQQSEVHEELMHRMVTALCSGRTLEEFVQTL